MRESETPAVRRLTALIRRQDGVVSRKQALECGVPPSYVRSRRRGGQWVAVFPGTYVTHNGSPTWIQRVWCAVLDAAPAVVSHESALQMLDGSGIGPVHISVDRRRNVPRRPGVVLHYRTGLAEVAVLDAHPPRMRTDYAVLDVAQDARSENAAVARMADAVQSGLTTADRLLHFLGTLSRARRGAFLRSALLDIRDGTCSVLEHRYLVSVERAHGLPVARRQAPTGAGRRGLRDAVYADWGLIVELDGRLFHDTADARDRDLERDLDAAVEEDLRTIRVGYGQVFDRACETAIKIAKILRRLGWTGELTPCRAAECPIRQCR
ncbi:type IV toxin-antitoxin system AbiEi family antitoxin domain-containing protein [Gordonia sp. PDNC005]|nr:type IV toxin-antitoxin system AbiEi family antitoxin domain-containing protein [Gordonia sp. PDNC005]